MRKGFKILIGALIVAVLVLLIGPVLLQLFGMAQGGHP